MTADYGLLNLLVSAATLLVVAATAIAALRQLRHMRGQNTLAGLVKTFDDWNDPKLRGWMEYLRSELPKRMAEPGFYDELDGPVDRVRHPELQLCDWHEQLGAWIKHGLLDEATTLDVSSSSTIANWIQLEPIITHMRRRRGDSLYENFEYLAARSLLFERAHPNGTYPEDTPRMRDLLPAAPREASVPAADTVS